MNHILNRFDFSRVRSYRLKTATLRERIIAQLIDGFLLGIVASFLYLLLSRGQLFSVWISPMFPQFLLEVDPAYSASTGALWWGGKYLTVALFYGKTIHLAYPSPLLWMVYAGYYTLFTSLYGQTPGKMVKKLVVVDENRRTLSLFHSLLRWIGYLVSFLPVGLGFWLMTRHPEGQTWHDRWQKSRVYSFE